MSIINSMQSRVLVAALAAVASFAPGVFAQGGKAQAPAAKPAAAAAADPWVAKSPKLGTIALKLAEPAFAIEFPKKDWVVAPSGGAAVLALVQSKGEASVIVERVILKAELGPDDITDLFAQLETEAIQQRAAKAADFKSKVLDVAGGRLVAVQFVMTGSKGPERVRQYSIPAGKDLYRVTCAAPIAQWAVYDPIFAHMAATFAPARTE